MQSNSTPQVRRNFVGLTLMFLCFFGTNVAHAALGSYTKSGISPYFTYEVTGDVLFTTLAADGANTLQSTVIVKNNATLTIDRTGAKIGMLQLGSSSGLDAGNGTLAFSTTISSNVKVRSTVFGDGGGSYNGTIMFNTGTFAGLFIAAGPMTNNAVGSTPTLIKGTGKLQLESTQTFTVFNDIYNLTINNGTITLGTDITVRNAFDCLTGIVKAAPATNLTLLGTFFNKSARIELVNGSVIFAGTTPQSINGTGITKTQFNNLIINNTTAPVTANISFTVNNAFTVNGVFHPSPELVATTSVLNGTGEVRITRSLGYEDFRLQYGAVTNSLSNLTLNFIGNAAQSTNADLSDVKKIFISNSAGEVRFTNVSLAPNGSMVVNAGSVVSFDPESVLTGDAGSSVTGTGKIVVTSSLGINDFAAQYSIPVASTLTIEFAGIAPQGVGASTFTSLIVNNVHGLTLNGNTTITKSLVLASGTINNTTYPLVLSGNPASIYARGGAIMLTPVVSNIVDVVYEGSNVDVATSQELTNIGSKVRNLTVNITGGNLLLSSDVTVKGTLIMQRGLLKLGNFNLTAGNFAVPVLGSYVQINGTGRLINSIPRTSMVTFPVGAGSYNPIRITNPSATGANRIFSVGVQDGIFDQYGTPYTDGSVNRTWDVQIDITTANVIIELPWVAANENLPLNRAQTSVYARTTGSWVKQPSGGLKTSGATYSRATTVASFASGTTVLYGVFDGLQTLPLGSEVVNNETTPEVTENIVANAVNTEMNIYPNPTVNNVTINLNGTEAGQTARITVMDLSGKVVMTANEVIEGSSFNTALNLDNLSRGNYIVNVATATANFNSKLVKL